MVPFFCFGSLNGCNTIPIAEKKSFPSTNILGLSDRVYFPWIGFDTIWRPYFKEINFRELELQLFLIICHSCLYDQRIFRMFFLFKFDFTEGKCIAGTTYENFDIPLNSAYFLLKLIVTNSETELKMCEPLFSPKYTWFAVGLIKFYLTEIISGVQNTEMGCFLS